jgi:hypothetical protein
MSANRILQYLIIASSPIILSSCNLPSSDPSNSISQDDLNLTAAAATVAAASQPTATQSSSPTQASSPTTDPSSGLKDEATFGGDVTIPDYSQIEAGEEFTKTWRLQNSGESTWTTDYSLVFKEGDQMGGPESVSLLDEVPPGELVDISVDLIAPDNPGTYTGFWVLHDADREPFGVDEDSEFTVFVIIRVVAEGASTEGGTPLENGVTLTGATLNASNANYTGACPVDLTFTGIISSTGSGSLVYAIVPTAETPGFVWNLPGSFTVNYNSTGNHSLDIFYNLTITSTVTGSAFVQVTGANIITSNIVIFNITCNS